MAFSSSFCLILLSCIIFKIGAQNVPKYTIDLGKKPEERWTNVIKDFEKPLRELKSSLESAIPWYLRTLVAKVAGRLDDHFGKPFADEIRGIAKVTGGDVGYIVLANVVVDVVTYCTSIITRDKDGKIWHARNLDYGSADIGTLSGFTKLLQNVTFHADFQRNGTTVYSGVTFAPLVGLLTAQKPNVFTVTIDNRNNGHWWMNILVALLDRNIQPLTFSVREILETAETYREAVDLLSYRITLSETYFIVGGVKPTEGVVISKGRFSVDDTWTLQPAPGRWYLVETNYDHWKLPIDERRQTAIKGIEKMGQNVTSAALLKVLSTPPVLNDITVYQVVMSAGRPELLYARISPYNDTNLRFVPRSP